MLILILVPIESVCDFLLVRHRNLGPILHFLEILQVFVLLASPLFHPIFCGGEVAAAYLHCQGEAKGAAEPPTGLGLDSEILENSTNSMHTQWG